MTEAQPAQSGGGRQSSLGTNRDKKLDHVTVERGSALQHLIPAHPRAAPAPCTSNTESISSYYRRSPRASVSRGFSHDSSRLQLPAAVMPLRRNANHLTRVSGMQRLSCARRLCSLLICLIYTYVFQAAGGWGGVGGARNALCRKQGPEWVQKKKKPESDVDYRITRVHPLFPASLHAAGSIFPD